MKLASLDTDTEEHIQKSLATLSHGRTMLVIAHRLSTMAAENRILVLQEGQLVESGTHEELLTMKAAMPTCGANKPGRKPKPRYKAREPSTTRSDECFNGAGHSARPIRSRDAKNELEPLSLLFCFRCVFKRFSGLSSLILYLGDGRDA